MKLDRIHIKNFRSIKDATIQFDHDCMILLGKNEAGKSNILKAVASVFGEYTVSVKDRRKKIDNEKIEEYFVRMIVKLEQYDINEILKRLQKIKNIDFVKFENGKLLSEFIEVNFQGAAIQIAIDNNQDSYLSFRISDENFWKFSKEIFITNNELSFEDGEKFDLRTLKKVLFKIVKEIYHENPISCNYWQYKEDFLLPSTVSISEFVANPSSQKALENVFTLCDREDVQKEFAEALAEDGDYSNLLEQVSEQTTKIFHKIWKDLKQTNFALIPNGSDEILIKVVDKAKYSFGDRSDGFKKFISILLMLSTKERSNQLDKHDLIIIDEPDQSLYPSSARHLRDELLKIAEKAMVIYSTHSQYMIDSTCIDRHLIVERKDDVTSFKKQDTHAAFNDNELLMNAIGSSIFECIRPINIIFEGWLDKQLFDKHCKFYKDKTFDKYGKVFLQGISGLETLVQLLILANKKFLIVADSDKASNDKRKDFGTSYSEYQNNWLSYGDVVSNISTMEDFLVTDFTSSTLIKYEKGFDYDASKNAIQNIERVASNDKEKKQRIKKALIASLTKENINNKYMTFIDELKKKLADLDKS